MKFQFLEHEISERLLRLVLSDKAITDTNATDDNTMKRTNESRYSKETCAQVTPESIRTVNTKIFLFLTVPHHSILI